MKKQHPFNISDDVCNVWLALTAGNEGACIIGTGGGCDYLMMRGPCDTDYIIAWADENGDTDCSSPDSLNDNAAVVAQIYEDEFEGHDGDQYKSWQSGDVIMRGTALECMVFMAAIEGVSFESRTWEGSF